MVLILSLYPLLQQGHPLSLGIPTATGHAGARDVGGIPRTPVAAGNNAQASYRTLNKTAGHTTGFTVVRMHTCCWPYSTPVRINYYANTRAKNVCGRSSRYFPLSSKLGSM